MVQGTVLEASLLGGYSVVLETFSKSSSERVEALPINLRYIHKRVPALVVWETVRICFALLSPPKKDLTLTYHIFQGDVVVEVEAQYSEGTTHCQR